MFKHQFTVIQVIIVLVILASLLLTIAGTSTSLLHKQKFNLRLTENAIRRLVEEVSRSLEVVRGLRFLEPVNVRIINTSWALRMWAPKEDVEIPAELLHKEMVYKLTFLIPYDKTIIQLEKSWIGMFWAATAGTTIYINIDYFNPYDPSARNVLAHELTHVLQFTHFKPSYPTTLDSILAVAALIEGDAGWTQHLYCVETKLCKPSSPVNIILHDLYLSLNLFPYIYGENFVKYLYEHGGWSYVDKAYEKPPKSTLMVIMPELYLGYLLNGVDIVVNVSIDIHGVGECVYNDVLGAYYIMLILARYIGLDKAQDLALNWRGDRISLYRYTDNSKTMWTVLWNISWSTPSYATNFYNNFTSMLREKGDVVELERERIITFINVSNTVKHVVEVELVGNYSTFIISRFVKESCKL